MQACKSTAVSIAKGILSVVGAIGTFSAIILVSGYRFEIVVIIMWTVIAAIISSDISNKSWF